MQPSYSIVRRNVSPMLLWRVFQIISFYSFAPFHPLYLFPVFFFFSFLFPRVHFEIHPRPSRDIFDITTGIKTAAVHFLSDMRVRSSLVALGEAQSSFRHVGENVKKLTVVKRRVGEPAFCCQRGLRATSKVIFRN